MFRFIFPRMTSDYSRRKINYPKAFTSIEKKLENKREVETNSR